MLSNKHDEISLIKQNWLILLIEDIIYYSFNHYNTILKSYIKSTFDNNSNKENNFDFKERVINYNTLSNIVLYILKMDRYLPMYITLTYSNHRLNHLSQETVNSYLEFENECALFYNTYSKLNTCNLLFDNLSIYDRSKKIIYTPLEKEQILNKYLYSNLYVNRYVDKIPYTLDTHLFNKKCFNIQNIDYYTITTSLVKLYLSGYILSELSKSYSIETLLKNNIISNTNIIQQTIENRFSQEPIIYNLNNSLTTLTNKSIYLSIKPLKPLKPLRFPTTRFLYDMDDIYLIINNIYPKLNNKLKDYFNNFEIYNNLNEI
jgi:hypothetical protein